MTMTTRTIVDCRTRSCGLVRMLVLLLAIVTALSGLTLDPVHAAGPDLRLRPDEGVPGDAIEARGRDFPTAAAGRILWDDGTELATFAADDDGAFTVAITVPDVPPGEYRVRAVAGEAETDDRFTVEAGDAGDDPATVPSDERATPPVAPVADAGDPCAEPATRDVPVTSAAELSEALVSAQPGDRILLADSTYRGNFVAGQPGTADARIRLCGSRAAVLDGDGWEGSGYALHVTASHWTVGGITVTNAQKGIMVDGAQSVLIDGVEVHTTGHEAVHFRAHSADGVIQDSDIHDTGLDNEKFGEGVYVGSAVSNWGTHTDGEPDRSDRVRVLRNRIWNTSSESIDLKEGTEGGLVEGNLFDGAAMTGADSWVDVKGNGYVIRGNTGTNAPENGFQTHVIDDMAWGRDNVFAGNTATVNGPGYGFYIHQPEETGNVVRCDNVVTGAGSGLTNLPAGCTG